jgi:hypothetical protein
MQNLEDEATMTSPKIRQALSATRRQNRGEKRSEKTLIIGESYEYTHTLSAELKIYKYITVAPNLTSAFGAHLKDMIGTGLNHV